jgi:hypothetical protein
MNSRKKGLQLLSEKYTRMIESRDEIMKGLDALSNEINLISFFKWLGNVPDKYSTTLDNTITYCVRGLNQYVARILKMFDDEIPDYESHQKEYQEAMKERVLRAFRYSPLHIAKIAPGLTREQALQAIENWEGL